MRRHLGKMGWGPSRKVEGIFQKGSKCHDRILVNAKSPYQEKRLGTQVHFSIVMLKSEVFQGENLGRIRINRDIKGTESDPFSSFFTPLVKSYEEYVKTRNIRENGFLKC